MAMGFRYLDQLATRENLQTFLELTDLAAGSGHSASNAFLLAHRLRDSPPMRLCQTILSQNSAASDLIRQRRLVGPYDVEALRALPKGSLGHTFVTVLETLGYDINFFPKPDFYNNLETDADYINYRVFATHDLHHILSGFSLDGFGEIGVISISVGQFNHPGLGFIDLISLLFAWLHNEIPEDQMGSHQDRVRTASYTFRLISHGLEIAAQARPLFPVHWEDQMGRNLEEVRAELGIEAVRQGPWSWYENPAIQKALGL